MKRNLCLLGIVLLASSRSLAAPTPLGTAFTYQGRLTDGGGPANGNYDLWIKLYDDSAAGTQISTTAAIDGQAVSNGLFTVTLDFGPGAIAGEARWLEIWVRTNQASAGYTCLAPRQPLTPAPSALYAPNAGVAAVSSNVVAGAIAAGQLGTSGAPSAGQVLSFDGSSLSWATLPVVPPPSWTLGGNSGTTPGVNFLGTSDNQPLQLRVNGLLGLCLTPSPSGGVNIVGGLAGSVAAGVDYGTVSGGLGNCLLDAAHSSTIAGGNQNRIGVNTQLAAIGGGGGNTMSSNSWYSTIAGGQGNTIGTGVGGGAIGGGSFNVLGNGAGSSTIGGGGGNGVGIGSPYNHIGGGAGNQVGAGVWYSVVGGGTANVASNNAVTVAGGSNNVASGAFSTISGGAQNVVTNPGDAIGGGEDNTATGGHSTIGGGQINKAQGPNSTVGGGYENWSLATSSTVSGGAANWAYSDYSTIGGGTYNQTLSLGAAIGGGKANYAGYYATIAGGLQNNADNLGAIGGGYGNIAQGWCATVPGGYTNQANGAYSFAAGRRAKAMADGAFVWADTTDADFVSAVTNQFAVRATGGVLLNAGTNNLELASGGIKVTGAGVGTATPVFVHKATPANTTAHYTTITNPHSDNNPGALLFVSHNWNQDNLSETHPLGVFYNSGHWAIYHEDGVSMPVGAAFNVIVIKP